MPVPVRVEGNNVLVEGWRVISSAADAVVAAAMEACVLCAQVCPVRIAVRQGQEFPRAPRQTHSVPMAVVNEDKADMRACTRCQGQLEHLVHHCWG